MSTAECLAETYIALVEMLRETDPDKAIYCAHLRDRLAARAGIILGCLSAAGRDISSLPFPIHPPTRRI